MTSPSWLAFVGSCLSPAQILAPGARIDPPPTSKGKTEQHGMPTVCQQNPVPYISRASDASSSWQRRVTPTTRSDHVVKRRRRPVQPSRSARRSACARLAASRPRRLAAFFLH
eukprot:scaffold1088_cov247-Pinguiococcus_pyrenoidosus.AAC.10